MTGSIFNAEQRAAWDRDGYVMVCKPFDDEEIAILRGAIEGDPALRESLYDRHDAAGKATSMDSKSEFRARSANPPELTKRIA